MQQLTVLQKAAATAKKPEYGLTIEDIEHELALKAKAKANLFGIEKDFAEELDRRSRELVAMKERVIAAQKYSGKFLPIDMKVLTWRDKNKLPMLTLFRLSNPTFSMSGMGEEGERSTQSHCNLPTELRQYYDDVMKLLVDKATKESGKIFRPARVTCRIDAKFSGVIPDSTREKIREAMKVFADPGTNDGLDRMFILAETEHKIITNKEALPIRLPIDPLVLAWDGRQQLWLVDEFDTTPLEEAAMLYNGRNLS